MAPRSLLQGQGSSLARLEALSWPTREGWAGNESNSTHLCLLSSQGCRASAPLLSYCCTSGCQDTQAPTSSLTTRMGHQGNQRTQNYKVKEPGTGQRGGPWPSPARSRPASSAPLPHTLPLGPSQTLAHLAEPWKHGTSRMPALSLASTGHHGKYHINDSALISCPQSYTPHLCPGPQQRPGQVGGRALVLIEGQVCSTSLLLRALRLLP